MRDTETSTAADVLPQTDWQKMSVEERTAYLVPLLGSRLHIFPLSRARKGRAIFGPSFPLPVTTGTFDEFAETGHRPGIHLTRVDGMIAFYHVGVTYAYDDLYDVQPAPPAPAPEPTIAPDYDGEDVYAEDEVACPCCGAKLRIVQRARVERAASGEDGDEVTQ